MVEEVVNHGGGGGWRRGDGEGREVMAEEER